MPDDTDLPLQDAPQDAETPQEANLEGNDHRDAGSEALIQLALTDLQSRREALQLEIDTLQQRKQQLEKDMGAAEAAATHHVPTKPTLADVVDEAMRA